MKEMQVKSLTDFEDHGGCRVSSSAAGPESVPAAQHDDFFEHLCNEPSGGWSLRMPVYQGGSIIVHLHRIGAHLFGHVNVVDDEGIVGFDGLHVADLQACDFQRHLRRQAPALPPCIRV